VITTSEPKRPPGVQLRGSVSPWIYDIASMVRKSRKYRKYNERLAATQELRPSIRQESITAFDSHVAQAAVLHANGEFRRAGHELRAARLLNEDFSKVAVLKLRAFYTARVQKKLAANGGLKICNKCNKRRRVTSFHRQSAGPTGTIYRRGICKDCAEAQKKAWRIANPVEHKKRWKRGNAKYRDRHHLKYRFGITVEQFAILSTACDGICQICKQPESRKNRRLSLDHDHATGRLRGFICCRCNLLIGRATDDPELLERAAFYLRNGDLSHLLSSNDAEALHG